MYQECRLIVSKPIETLKPDQSSSAVEVANDAMAEPLQANTEFDIYQADITLISLSSGNIFFSMGLQHWQRSEAGCSVIVIGRKEPEMTGNRSSSAPGLSTGW